MPQFCVEKNSGSFGSEKMPAISRREICRQFQVGKYASNFGPEKKCRQIRAGKKCQYYRIGTNVGKFEPEKNAGKFWPKKNAGVFGREKIA